VSDEAISCCLEIAAQQVLLICEEIASLRQAQDRRWASPSSQ
jgi:hypothetical protein